MRIKSSLSRVPPGLSPRSELRDGFLRPGIATLSTNAPSGLNQDGSARLHLCENSSSVAGNDKTIRVVTGEGHNGYPNRTEQNDRGTTAVHDCSHQAAERGTPYITVHHVQLTRLSREQCLQSMMHTMFYIWVETRGSGLLTRYVAYPKLYFWSFCTL